MNDPIAWPANPFWDFSLALYRRPGVADACIAVQERHGLDVNLVLYFLWLGVVRGVRLSDTDVAATVARVAEWHDTAVRPLRAIRTHMKRNPAAAPRDMAEPLRARIKAAELDAERIEQQMLYSQKWSSTPDAPAAQSAARDNIYSYLENRSVVPTSEDVAAIDKIISAAEI